MDEDGGWVEGADWLGVCFVGSVHNDGPLVVSSGSSSAGRAKKQIIIVQKGGIYRTDKTYATEEAAVTSTLAAAAIRLTCPAPRRHGNRHIGIPHTVPFPSLRSTTNKKRTDTRQRHGCPAS
ncbi:hypothetical protein BC938DRAFT_479441 [Jimgerdemannia flammicorona]|uniref:Uncharacterized protein n=1 Tax=Jimgerdemannia flammicorona TaxID=994334 RepID=A0A433QKV7_9FUNG|nr:hypothetical protein BC938DRAFT_479441 [Jimgerdemannia flammicorona]